MREYLTRAGMTRTTNGTFGESSTRDGRQNGAIKSALGEAFNSSGTVNDRISC